MDTRLLLTQAITLLYYESHIPNKTENSADLVRTVLEQIKQPKVMLSISNDHDHVDALKKTALTLAAQDINAPIERCELLQRLKVNCNTDEHLYDAFAQSIERELDESALKRLSIGIRKTINDDFRETEMVTLLAGAYRDVNFGREKIKDLRKYFSEFHTKIEPYLLEATGKDPAVIDSMDLSNLEEMSEIFEEVIATNNKEGIFITGWQDLNNMLQGGFRRGEQWVLPALQHKYKTGFSLTLFKQFAIYNKPVMLNPAKKPLLLRISFEDEVRNNLRFLYQNFYENEFGKKADLHAVSKREMAAYVKAKMEVNGFTCRMMRVNPSEWTYKDIQNTVLQYEAEGYEVQLLMLDYLPMLPTTGCEQGPTGTDLQDMYRRMRNFCSARKILMITPHQLSTDAKQLIREGSIDFVKLLPGKGYYRGSKQIDQEVDGELYLHIEKLNGRSYFTIQRGKHRGVDPLPDDLQYVAYLFPEGMSLPDDLLGACQGLKKVGGLPPGHSQGGGGQAHSTEPEFWSYT